MFLDLDDSFIENKIEFQRPEKWNIDTNSKQSVIYNYKKTVFKQFEEHNIFKRAEQIWLESQLTLKDRDEFLIKLNVLDTQITKIVRGAEKRSTNRMPSTEWSVEIHHVSIV